MRTKNRLMQDGREHIAVTGGAGFVGSHLVGALLDHGASKVTVIDDFSRGRRENLAAWIAEPRLKIVGADVCDIDGLRDALGGVRVIYHLAAQATVMGAARDLDRTFRTNVVGTYNVLKVAADLGVRRLVFASSREVYGEPVSLPVAESHPLLPVNSYGASKVAGEALCRAFARECGLETSILRLANVYGDRDSGRVIPHWIEQARRGNDLVVYGGAQVIDFVWVGDVTRAFMAAAATEIPVPPINLASGTGTKILDLARRIVHLANSDSQIRVVPSRPIEVTRYIGSTDRMIQLLGLQPTTDPLAQLGSMIRGLAVAVA